jgi:hypothetical protein
VSRYGPNEPLTYMTRRFVVALVACAACKGTAQPDANVQACRDLAVARCAVTSCTPARFQSEWPDLATCRAREQLACEIELSSNGTGATPAGASACAAAITAALAAEPCLSYLVQSPPSACLAQGTLPLGASCSFDSQCMSQSCSKNSGSCGTCIDKLPPAPSTGACGGESGPAAQCPYGTTCIVADLPPHTGLCTPLTMSSGFACDYALPCSLDAGLACSRSTQTCEPITFVGIGEACDGSTTLCEGAFCNEYNTCEAFGADDAPCASLNDPPCAYPLQCLGSCQATSC